MRHEIGEPAGPYATLSRYTANEASQCSPV
jgi:hypothetical protein